MAYRRNRVEEEDVSYWLSYSDMMAALLLVFVLIITFTMLQSKAQYEKKQQELAMQQELVTANGRSYSSPVYDKDGIVDMEASRRVEVKFRIKNEEQMDEILKITNK